VLLLYVELVKENETPTGRAKKKELFPRVNQTEIKSNELKPVY